MMFTIVLAVIVTPFAVAWADTATDPSSTTTPDLAAPTPPPDPAKPDATTPATPPETTEPATDPTTVAPTTDTTNPPTTTAPAPPTTAAPTPTADDGDGIAATIEDTAPNGGDGNRDGLVDSRQSNVASLPAAVDVNGNGGLDDYVTIVAPEGTTLTNVRALEVPGDTPPPDGVSLPYGLFEYEVTVASPGDTADVTYVLPDEGVAPTSVHMLQNGVWTDYADHTSVDSVNGKVTVAFRDGGEGDETGTSDGVIKDPSGPSTTTTPDPAAPTPAPDPAKPDTTTPTTPADTTTPTTPPETTKPATAPTTVPPTTGTTNPPTTTTAPPTTTTVPPTTTTAPEVGVGSAATSTALLPAPTIVSDKADYPPGGTVVLTGTNWLPLDTVTINVNDDRERCGRRTSPSTRTRTARSRTRSTSPTSSSRTTP